MREEQLQAQKQQQPLSSRPRSPARTRRPRRRPPDRRWHRGRPRRPLTAAAANRDDALKASQRIPIATGSLQGSIALKGARIDDISLSKFRETVDPKSPPIVLLSPSGSPDPFYAEFGWTGAAGSNAKLPTGDTVWKQEGSGALAVGHPGHADL